MFRGRFECRVDQKGRLLLPTAYRQALPSKEKSLVITNSLYKGRRCLDVYSLKEWEKLEKKVAKMPSFRAEVQAYQRFYLASGQVVEADKNNRLLVPQTLRKFSDLTDEVVCVGMGHKFEIWSSDVWNQLFSGMAENFENILATIADIEEVD